MTRCHAFTSAKLCQASQGHKQSAEWAQFAWKLLAAQGQRIVKEGKKIEAAEENRAELNVQAQAFADKGLPVPKALMIA